MRYNFHPPTPELETCENTTDPNIKEKNKSVSVRKQTKVFYFKISEMVFNYCYNIDFAIPVVGFSIYCNVPRLSIVTLKTVIIHSEICILKACYLHDDVST